MCKTRTQASIAVLLLCLISSVVAQDEHHPVELAAITGADIQSLQSREIVIGRSLDDRSRLAWQKRVIQSLWRELNPNARQITERQINLVLKGEMLVEIPNFTLEVAQILVGEPTIRLESGSVGMLMIGKNGQFWPLCTVILTKPDTVLTALHCVDNRHNGETLKVYFPYEGLREITSESKCCNTDDDDFSATIDDLAQLTLASPYHFLPAFVNVAAKVSNVNTMAKILGYGFDQTDLSDNGILREGTVSLSPCNLCDATTDTNASDGGRSLCFDFVLPGGLAEVINSQGNQGGDSGGPMYLDETLFDSLIGVSRAIDWSCSDPGEREGKYVNVTNDAYQSWLGSAFCSSNCISTSTDVVDIFFGEPDDSLGESNQKSYNLKVDVMAKKLIVTLNHVIGGYTPKPNDLEMIMPAGLNADCIHHDGVEVCTANNPAVGNYTLKVTKIKGDPDFQLAASVIRCPNEVCWLQHLASDDGRN